MLTEVFPGYMLMVKIKRNGINKRHIATQFDKVLVIKKYNFLTKRWNISGDVPV